MKRAMIDIETLGTTMNAIIAEVGIVISEPGKDDFLLHLTLDWREQEQLGRGADVYTLLWWSQKDRISKFAELGKRQNLNRQRLAESLDMICFYLRDCDELWANSPTFDLAIINSLLQQAIKAKLSYKAEMDFRTARKLHPDVPYDYPEDAHDALADAQAQVAHLRKLEIWSFVSVSETIKRRQE